MGQLHALKDTSHDRNASVPRAKTLGTRTGVQAARRLASAALRSALKVHGITHERFADSLGVSRSLVRNWCDEDHERTIGDAYKIVARQVGLGGVIDSYRAALDVVDLAKQPVARDRLRQLQVEVGDVARTEMDAVADGVIDRGEHLALAREWLDVAKVAQEAHEYHLREAMREG